MDGSHAARRPAAADPHPWRRRHPPLRSPWPAAPQYHLPRTGSTMEDARRLVRQAPVTGALITADYQTRGRGRSAGRRWVSAPGRNLLFNLLLHADAVGPVPQRLPLLCGLAVAGAVEASSGAACQVKWPNDVLMRGSKVAGCLCERLDDWYSAGVGVTCNQRRGLPPGSARDLPAASVWLRSGRRVRRWPLLELILGELHRLLDEPGWAALVDRRLFARGRWVRLDGAGRGLPRCARVVRVAATGGLVVRDAAGAEHTCFAGSARLLDRPPPPGAPGAEGIALPPAR